MKILFISEFLYRPYGGAQNSARAHLRSLKEIVGEKNVDVVAVSNNPDEDRKDGYVLMQGYTACMDNLRNVLQGNPTFFSEKGNRIVYEMLQKKQYDVVFLDNSVFGKIAKHIKKRYPDIRIVTNFHGIKYNSRLQLIRKCPYNPAILLSGIALIKNEKEVVKSSDVMLVLNQRENEMMQKYHHKSATYFLPVYFIDTAKIENVEDDGLFHILFVGGRLWANMEGIQWFIRNVMPKLGSDICLDVVGNGMERLKREVSKDSRIRIWGRVDSLDYYYNLANLVIGPIFHGDGMKTKTAEALMYGKIFIGSDEALCGYECLDDYRCNTPDEYVKTINDIKSRQLGKYSEEMKELFNRQYSMKMARKILEKAIYSPHQGRNMG